MPDSVRRCPAVRTRTLRSTRWRLAGIPRHYKGYFRKSTAPPIQPHARANRRRIDTTASRASLALVALRCCRFQMHQLTHLAFSGFIGFLTSLNFWIRFTGFPGFPGNSDARAFGLLCSAVIKFRSTVNPNVVNFHSFFLGFNAIRVYLDRIEVDLNRMWVDLNHPGKMSMTS